MKTECKCLEAVERILKTHNELHDAPQTLARKFQAFREKRGNGSGKDYWKGLEEIAEEYYHNL